MSRFPVVYDRAVKPSGGPQPGAVHLMDWCLANVPTATNLGIYNNRSVRGGSGLSLHAEGRALDVGFPAKVGGTAEGWALAELLLTHHPDLGIQTLIYARKIWSTTRGGWRAYGGTAAHNEHIHVELNRRAARELTPQMINETLGGSMAILANEHVLTIQKAVNSVGWQPALAEDGKAGDKTATAVEDLIRSRSALIAERDRLHEEATEREILLGKIREHRDTWQAHAEQLQARLDAQPPVGGATVVPAELKRKAEQWDAHVAGFRAVVQDAGFGS